MLARWRNSMNPNVTKPKSTGNQQTIGTRYTVHHDEISRDKNILMLWKALKAMEFKSSMTMIVWKEIGGFGSQVSANVRVSEGERNEISCRGRRDLENEAMSPIRKYMAKTKEWWGKSIRRKCRSTKQKKSREEYQATRAHCSSTHAMMACGPVVHPTPKQKKWKDCETAI